MATREANPLPPRLCREAAVQQSWRRVDGAWATWPNVRVTDRRKDHELDFVVAIPGAGVVCIEVKGGQVSYDGATWRQTHYDGTSKQIHPVDQARDGKYALRAYVEKDPRWGSRSRVRWAHAVVFPFTDLPDDFATPDCPRSMAFGRDDLDGLVDALARIPASSRRPRTDHRLTTTSPCWTTSCVVEDCLRRT